jgi:hypothetical protein
MGLECWYRAIGENGIKSDKFWKNIKLRINSLDISKGLTKNNEKIIKYLKKVSK